MPDCPPVAPWRVARPRSEDVGVNEVAEALRSARAAWDDATRDGGRACGMDVAEQAYAAMRAAWFGELGAHIAVLGEPDVQ
jgi:hypothetical protein